MATSTKDDVLWQRAVHEAAHVVSDALQSPPVFYNAVFLWLEYGAFGASVPGNGRVLGAIADDYASPSHQQAARAELPVLMAGPAASSRLDPKRSRQEDVSDYDRAKAHTNGLSAIESSPAESYIASAERAAEELVDRYWEQIHEVARYFVARCQGPQAKVAQSDIAGALAAAGLPTGSSSANGR